ncbi:hypothetical protein RCL_jg13879.t1 [Rhizophagus clarus]|uniref:Uncharacterized protein n=1 Tax=Rhizophagus clarus TaxID=94130 RepID=A0A8H3LTK3_9GLOM|nr:hypothetical protein RCL_jg13879.t1 [Rhizophagus clarus]
MPRKTKRQQQVSKIPRKKEHYIEDEKNEDINNWTKKDLNEFEKIGKRLITKVLHWQENAAHSIRAVYNRTSKTTV